MYISSWMHQCIGYGLLFLTYKIFFEQHIIDTFYPEYIKKFLKK